MENDEIIEGVNAISSLDNEAGTLVESEPFVIPNIYKYSGETKEYIGFEQAEKNPAESIKQGKFVPLVPANATLLEPPECEENQIQVYSRTIEEQTEIDSETGEERTIYESVENWTIEADYRKNFYKVDENLNVSKITTIGEQTGFMLVDKEIWEDIKINKDWYKITDNEIVKKSDEEYEADMAEKERVRIANLRLTRGDVFRGLLLAKGIMRAEIRGIIEAMSEETQEERLTKEMALIDFDEALEFYRGVSLIDTLGSVLGITSEQMDKFFDTKEWKYLKETEGE